MAVSVVASKPHYADHLRPVFDGLPVGTAGVFDTGGRVPKGDRVMVAGWSDLRRVRGRDVVLMEHGAGQSYVGLSHGSYAGGAGRGGVGMFLYPSDAVAEVNRKAYPKAKHVTVGCPRLDVLWQRRQRWHPTGRVAVSFHWRCGLAPESGTAFDDWRNAVARLVADGVDVIGHGHPRMWPELRHWWSDLGVTPMRDWADVVEAADVYVCDNSSTIFEAAAVGLPVVLLNARGWRRDVEHGLRFWSHADVGPNVWPGDDLAEAISWAPLWNRSAVAGVYDRLPDGSGAATRAAVESVVAWAN